VESDDTSTYPWVSVRIPDKDVYHRRDRVPVALRSDRDGYATILRVDTDGRVRVLFPGEPQEDNFVRGGQELLVPNPYGYDVAHTFAVDDYPGLGYVFAVVSRGAFDYRPYVRNGQWDYRRFGIDGRITGDPYVAISEIVEYMLPPGSGGYGFDAASYFVDVRYEYPRFVCYDCHAYTAYPVWDPYRDWCGTFKLVIYDEPAWYPTTLYPATHVVPAGGTVVHPQFVIKGRTATEPHVVHAARSGDRRAPVESGVRGRDIGGVGRVKAPRENDRPGGIGGLIRRLFSGDDPSPRTNTREIAPPRGDPAPTLERRKKGDPQQGAQRSTGSRRDGTRPVNRSGSTPDAAPRAPTRRAPTPAKKPSADRRPASRGRR
jgi:hypothetical protein